jgi:hypothetical protein
MPLSSVKLIGRFNRWFFEGARGRSRKTEPIKKIDKDAWWKVMCLTGVDYFSTLGYQPGIAFLAAGLLSPLATLILVALTLFGAVPVYRHVAKKSPHGQGSVYMLEKLLPGWRGKTLLLCVLGFAFTDFVITITLSAADAATHLVQNPLLTPFVHEHRMTVTIALLTVLAAIFLMGFREAIGISFVLVSSYLVLNAIVIVSSVMHLAANPQVAQNWSHALFAQYHSFPTMIGVSLVLFPKLALGLSGFETGVAVMPNVRGDDSDTEESPKGRIRNTQYLLLTAATIMSLFLICSSFVTTLLIPAEQFLPGHGANGRALAYLAHLYLGPAFGTLYDLSTILILWFAGASAMAGLLNLVPRYLPRYGMAPNWARAMRPLVLFFTLVSFIITIIFHADVDAQGGAYATGVLVLISSAALAVCLSVWKENWLKRLAFLTITLIFFYTTVVNCIERPDGLKIGSLFILTILITSLISRVLRSTELRVDKVTFDAAAEKFFEEDGKGVIRIIGHDPTSPASYQEKFLEAKQLHNIGDKPIIFLEVHRGDASDFTEDELEIEGITDGPFRILRCECPAVPNAIAALMLAIRNKSKQSPHLYLGWTEGNPLLYVLKYIFLGEGETAPVTREILREAEPDPRTRPRVHVA